MVFTGNTTKKIMSPRLFCFLRRLLHNTTDRAETVFGHLEYKKIVFCTPCTGVFNFCTFHRRPRPFHDIN